MTLLAGLLEGQEVYARLFTAAMRWLMPILTVILLIRCIYPLIAFRREPEIWAWLCMGNGTKLPVTHWENVIGRNKNSDIVIDFPTVSKIHGVLTRYDDGSWSISDAESKDGTRVNGELISVCEIGPDDVISIGGVEMKLQPISKRQEQRLAQLRTKSASVTGSFANVLLLTVIQVLCCVAFLLGTEGHAESIILGFSGIVVCQWVLLLFYFCMKRTSFEVEALAFFLCTLGMAVIAAVKPDESVKQLIAIVLGMILFILTGLSLRNLKFAQIFRYLAAVAGIGFLVVTLLFGQEYYGAKNWLVINSISLQPSELSKVCFVYVGASVMHRIVMKRNMFLFIGYSAAICGCLALMNDFGTALIFFCAFLVIAYMRSGSVGTLALACMALAFAGVLALKIAPHALRRFESWRHIWEVPLDGGYQQTRALMCMASGGFFGLGAGNGWMKHMFAADSDVAVATLGEEWGLFMVLMAMLAVIALAIFSIRSAAVGRSSFYIISACAAAAILIMQVILNLLGTVDVLPLTGVTFPFLSNGGSSMICSWGLLAFIKAADTRQNASFAVRLAKNGGTTDE